MNKFDDFISKISNTKVHTPHANNLIHKINSLIKSGKFDSQNNIFNEIAEVYSKLLDNNLDTSDTLDNWVRKQVRLINEYLCVLAKPNMTVFNHQSDFKSSVIPELICMIFFQIIQRSNLPLEVNGQNDIIIDLLFSHKNGGQVFPKNKRVDACLLLPCPMVIKGSDVQLKKFGIPLVAVEVKTNLDKNMISGIVHSVEKLKSTFPECKYYVLSEFSDFDTKNQNYSNSSIDEIYFLRKQKRSEFRSTKVANDISEDLILEFVKSVNESVFFLSEKIENVGDKLNSGKLIGK